MAFWDVFRKKKRFTLGEIDPKAVIGMLSAELAYRKLAFMAAVNLIAAAAGNCEIVTYMKNKPVKGEKWYRLNIQPNPNQSAAEFWRQLLYTLYHENEVLAVTVKGDLFIADSFIKNEDGFSQNVFSGVQIGGKPVGGNFPASDVLYWTLGDENVKAVVDQIYDAYGKLIAYSSEAHKLSKGRRAILKIDAGARGTPGWEEKYNKLINEELEPFMNADVGVQALFNGMDYTEIGENRRTAAGENTTRDIKELIMDVFDLTAHAFGIPPALLRGDKLEVEKLLENFVSFCVKPLCRMLAEEINRKTVSRKEFLEGSYAKFDLSKVRHNDPLSSGPAIDKLIAARVLNTNTARDLIGLDRIEEPWADEYLQTKNYGNVES